MMWNLKMQPGGLYACDATWARVRSASAAQLEDLAEIIFCLSSCPADALSMTLTLHDVRSKIEFRSDCNVDFSLVEDGAIK